MATAALDWTLLIGVRERRRDTVREALQRELHETAGREQRVRQAQDAWQAQVAAREAHAQATRQSTSVAALAQAGAWHGALDHRIAEHAQQLAQAREQLRRQQQVLAQARQALLKSEAELDQAREQQRQQRRAQRRVAELRSEDALEETGVQGWDARQREMA